MSSHHHHHHHSCCCCCCSSSCSIPPHPPSDACTSNADAILQALAANLLLQYPTPPPPSAHFPYPYLNPYQPHPYHHHHLYHPQDDQISDERLLRRQHHHQAEFLHSLAHRAAAVDSSFLSSHPSPPPPPPPADKKQHKRHPPPSSFNPPTPPPPHSPVALSSPSPLRTSLRDLAARTIQVTFRRHLVRRSQTLRQLKDLAIVKSHAAALRSATSDEKCRDPEALSERAANLLLHLDAIQSADPMIREGKKSVSRELSRILDFIDKVLLKEHLLTPEAAEIEANEDCGRTSAKTPARKVRFFDDAKRSEASFGRLEPGDSSHASNENGHVEGLARELIATEARGDLTESNGYYQVSDDEGSSEDSAAEGTGGKHAKGRNFTAAPMPVQMEARKR